MSAPVPLWVEAIVAVLLLASGFVTLLGASGLVRLKTFFLRMHPPALASTFGVWSSALASIIYFSVLDGEIALRPWVFPIILAITVPVTTVLLARAALFRKRQAGADVPSPLRES